jgi:ATP-dependent Lon protease
MNDSIDIDAALGALPLFPLPHVVLFPRALLPLHVFEPRYRTMLKDCLETHRAMAIVLVPDPNDVDAHGHPKIARVAGVGLIVEHEELADGRANIVIHGHSRVAIEELPFVPPYRIARATLIEDVNTPVSDTDRAALLSTASSLVAELTRRDPRFSFALPPSLPPGRIADLCAHHLIVDAGTRQELLEERDVCERVRRITGELALQRTTLTRESGRGASN